MTSTTIEIVSKIAGYAGFVVLTWRSIFERFLVWINRNPRFAKYVDATLKSAATFLFAAPAMLITCRLAGLGCLSKPTSGQRVGKKYPEPAAATDPACHQAGDPESAQTADDATMPALP